MNGRIDVFPLETGLYRLVETDEAGRFTDSYLLIGADAALLIDTQRCPGKLYETVRALADRPLEVVITHLHPDHFGPSAADFLRAGVPVWVFREELEALAAFDPVAFPVRCDAEFGLRGLREGQEFDLGGLRLRVLALTGHTPKGAMLLEPDRGWLFSGDALGNRSFWMQVDGASSLETFAAALEAQLAVLQAVPRLRIFTGHGIGECWQGMDWAEAVLQTTKAIVRGAACGHPAESHWPGTLCLDTPVFPEGYFYRAARVRAPRP